MVHHLVIADLMLTLVEVGAAFGHALMAWWVSTRATSKKALEVQTGMI